MSSVPSRSPRALWLLAALVLTLSAPAQAKVRPSLELGANLSSLGYEHLEDISFITDHWDPGWRMTLAGGVLLEVPVRSRLSLLTGLRYLEQGNRVKLDFPAPFPLTGKFRIAQHYLAVPALVAVRPFRSRRILLAAGPEGAWLMNGKMYTETSPPDPRSSTSITKNLKPANLSLDAQASLEFPAARHAVSITLRYTHGLIDVQRKQDWGVAWKTRGVEGLVGMRW